MSAASLLPLVQQHETHPAFAEVGRAVLAAMGLLMVWLHPESSGLVLCWVGDDSLETALPGCNYATVNALPVANPAKGLSRQRALSLLASVHALLDGAWSSQQGAQGSPVSHGSVEPLK